MTKELADRFDELLDKKIILGAKEQKVLEDEGVKTATIASPQGIFVVRFDPGSIETFMRVANDVLGWKDTSPESFYCYKPEGLDKGRGNSIMFTHKAITEKNPEMQKGPIRASISLKEAVDRLRMN